MNVSSDLVQVNRQAGEDEVACVDVSGRGDAVQAQLSAGGDQDNGSGHAWSCRAQTTTAGP
jgi:hypothetical protein